MDGPLEFQLSVSASFEAGVVTRHTGRLGLWIKFVPEQSAWLMFVVRVGLLTVLYALSRLRHRSSGLRHAAGR